MNHSIFKKTDKLKKGKLEEICYGIESMVELHSQNNKRSEIKLFLCIGTGNKT